MPCEASPTRYFWWLRRRLRPAAAFAGVGHPLKTRGRGTEPEWTKTRRDPCRKRSRRLPAGQTILNAIGNLLADGCQVQESLFAEDIFGFFGELPIRRRLVPKVIIPIHACHCARDLSWWLRATRFARGSASHSQLLTDLPQQDIVILFCCRTYHANSHEAGAFETGMGLAARLRRRGDEFRLSKVVQLSAAIAPRGFVLPKHLNLMSSDAGNRAWTAGLMVVFANPDDAVAQR